MKKALPLLLLACCAAIFTGTIFFLLKSRFETGDVYPASSSLRGDPFGTMALYDSLAWLPGLSVARDLSPANRLPDGRGHTYLHFAADPEDWKLLPAELFRTLDEFVLAGGRLVITMTPKASPPRKEKKEEGKKETPANEGAGKKPEEKKKAARAMVSVAAKWGLEVSAVPGGGGQNGRRFLVKNESSLALPKELPWHGDVVLAGSDASWKTLYAGRQGPVLAEKLRGAGTIVVATDSYFVSNEALVRDRQPDLLAWIVGPNHSIVFDEAHLGITESPGLAALARKYRLHGGAAALLVLAVLFVWKNSSSLAPPRNASGKSEDVIAGRDAMAGFVGLLRRNVPGDRLLDICVGEWRKSFARSSRFTVQEKAAFDAIVAEENARPPRDRDPLETCRKLSAVLRRTPARPHV